MAILDPSPEPVPTPAAPPIEVCFDKFSTFLDRYAARLSLGGLFLETSEPRPVGSEVAFEIRLDDGYRLIRGSGRVEWVRVRPLGSERPAGMAVRFEALDEASRDLVLKILEEHVKDGGQPFDVDEVPGDVVAQDAAAGPAAVDPPASGAEPPFAAPWGEELPEAPLEVLEEPAAVVGDHGEIDDVETLRAGKPETGEVETRPRPLVDPFDRDVLSSAEDVLEEIEAAETEEDAEDLDAPAVAVLDEPEPGFGAPPGDAAAVSEEPAARPQVVAPPTRPAAREPSMEKGEPARPLRRRLVLGAGLALLLAAGVWIVRGPIGDGPPVMSEGVPAVARPSEVPPGEAERRASRTGVADPPADVLEAAEAEVVVGEDSPAPAPASTPELFEPPLLTADDPPQDSEARPGTPTPPARELEEIVWERREGGTLIILRLDGSLDESRARYDRLSWTDGREQLSLAGFSGPYRAASLDVRTPEILRIRTGFHPGPGAGELRLVFDLPPGGPGMSEIRHLQDRLEILYAAPR